MTMPSKTFTLLSGCALSAFLIGACLTRPPLPADEALFATVRADFST